MHNEKSSQTQKEAKKKHAMNNLRPINTLNTKCLGSHSSNYGRDIADSSTGD